MHFHIYQKSLQHLFSTSGSRYENGSNGMGLISHNKLGNYSEYVPRNVNYESTLERNDGKYHPLVVRRINTDRGDPV